MLMAANVDSGTRWRRTGRVALAILVFMFGFPIVYTALVPERRPPLADLTAVPNGAYRVYVVDWGYHTAIIIQQPQYWRLGSPGEETAPFLEFAWGDRRFYYESDYWPHAVFATLALPTESVLYLDGRPDPPPLRGARAAFYRVVDADTLRALLMEIERSARHDTTGSRVSAYPPAAGYSGRFFAAHGSYLWTRNCNWWTVERLARVGLATRPTGVIITAQVPSRLRGFVRVR
jgi:uncharacterized protein DUF2459